MSKIPGPGHYFGRYQKEIKKLWLDTYFNKKEIDGFSVLRHVEYEDEWLVEPYIKTRFDDLSDEHFENTLKEYSTFLYYNGLLDKASKESFNNKKLKLDFKDWKKIKLGFDEKENPNGLFVVMGSKTTDKKILDEEHTKGKRQYPYVTTQSTNNGVRDFYNTYTDKGNILTIDSAVVGFCSYQPLNFTASDHVEKLIPRFDLNVYRALFLTTVINMEQYRYSYGRKFNQDRIRDTVIKLPFRNERVDWDFIDDYIKGLKYSKHLELLPEK